MKTAIRRYEAFLRIDDQLSLTDRTRSRVIYLTGYVFVLVQLVNMATMYVLYEGWDRQHLVSLGACIVFISLTNALRYNKSATFYGLAYTILAVGAVGYSATLGSSANQASGIDTPLIVLLVAAMALVCYVGTRMTVAVYAVCATALLLFLYNFSVGEGLDHAGLLFAQQRFLQGALAIIVVGCVTLFTSRLVYHTMDNQQAAVTRATEAENARANLMATVTHEIRTPLNGIVAMSDMLSQSPSLNDDDRASVELLTHSADALMQILNETLDRARADATAETPIASEPFDPAALAAQVCGLFRSQADARALWIGTDVAPDVPNILIGDAPHLRQVLSNLVGNAIKFTTSGGVRLGMRLHPDATAPDDAEHVGLVFYVQDTGVGIAPDEQARVFERFGQSASAATSCDNGTGLGLPISRDLVRAMGGELTLQSVPGQGTVFQFTLRLPVARRALAA